MPVAAVLLSYPVLSEQRSGTPDYAASPVAQSEGRLHLFPSVNGQLAAPLPGEGTRKHIVLVN